MKTTKPKTKPAARPPKRRPCSAWVNYDQKRFDIVLRELPLVKLRAISGGKDGHVITPIFRGESTNTVMLAIEDAIVASARAILAARRKDARKANATKETPHA